MDKEAINTAFLDYLSEHSESLRTNYLSRIQPFLDWLAPFELSTQSLNLNHFQGYIFHMQEQGSDRLSLNNTLSALRNLLYMFIKNGEANEQLAMEFYIKGIFKKPFPPLFSWQEMESMYEQFSTPGLSGQRNKAILGLLFYQALTVDEIINLEINHLDLNNKQVHIPQTHRGRARSLNLEQHQTPILEEYLHKTREKLLLLTDKESDKLFISMSEKQEGINITDNLRSTLRKRYPQISSYPQLRASTLLHWYHTFGLETMREMAGHYYITAITNT
ncbi:tyrosine-type recombinase/integrase [Pseudotamlana carrageenivorans]|uniref:Integrase n=1 Tax=Pseudotamlana carrageenivorans TaxID=2069432 RepID=A0A2I7SG95_9FLAO|nr:site-specific integrase [Tamlana carrageenivorans]AUS04926.1 hypothetical protein C1A40_05330 [Tamlana carrageenivorans]